MSNTMHPTLLSFLLLLSLLLSSNHGSSCPRAHFTYLSRRHHVWFEGSVAKWVRSPCEYSQLNYIQADRMETREKMFSMRPYSKDIWMQVTIEEGLYNPTYEADRIRERESNIFENVSNNKASLLDTFRGICISNVTIGMRVKAKKVPWTCVDVEGVTSGVVPQPCELLPDQVTEKFACNFPSDTSAIDNVEFQKCSYRMKL